MPAASLPFKTLLLVLTGDTHAPVNVELAPRRREAVTPSGRRGRAGRYGGQVRPGHGGGVVHVQVLEGTPCGVGCIRRGRAAGHVTVASDGTSRDCGRPRPGRAGGGGLQTRTSRESGDGGKARVVQAGLDGRLSGTATGLAQPRGL
jgi:hypothetical protein